MKKLFQIKKNINPVDITYLAPDTLIVLAHVVRYCNNNSIPLVITNFLNVYKVSKSKTHSQGRAFDVSVRGWTEIDVQNCISYIESKVGVLGAISARTGKKVIAYYHDAGLGKHIHFQVRSTE